MKNCFQKTNDEIINNTKKILADKEKMTITAAIIFLLVEFFSIISLLEYYIPEPSPVTGFAVALTFVAFFAVQITYGFMLYNNCNKNNEK